jgi:hypothetical protein
VNAYLLILKKLIFLWILACGIFFSACTSRTTDGQRTGFLPQVVKFLNTFKGSPKELFRDLDEEGKKKLVETLSPEQSMIIKKQKIRGEVLKEMYQVVLQKEPQDLEEFSGYREAMVQGATFEGIYNGFTHSSNYRLLEMHHPGSGLETVRLFAEELEILERELSDKTLFHSKSALPLPVLENPAYSLSQQAIYQGRTEAKKIYKGKEAVDYYTRVFYMASMYTLKRVLGDEAMKVVDLKRANQNDLARWYGNWAATLAHKKIDFGLTLRNNTDAEFHYQWALSVPEDLLRWEVLNRLHRLINEANRKKI